MNRVHTAGFTIIEVMLFLAVSGALAAGLLASTQLAINEQRYRDTLTGVQNQIQKQYNETYHVVNTRESHDSIDECDGARGASDCIVLGRLVRIDKQEIKSSSIIASLPVARDGDASNPINGIPLVLEDDDDANDPENEEEYFKLYDLHEDMGSTATYEVPWSAEINNIADAQEVRMLIIRSPQTGLVYTYSHTDAQAGGVNYETLIDAANRASRALCIPRGGTTLGVIIQANASNANAVELMTDSTDVCGE